MRGYRSNTGFLASMTIIELRKRFRIFAEVLAVVFLLSVVKASINWFQLEFLTLNALFTSAVGAAVFIIGFLLSGVLSDYKEADRIPGELRTALESIYEDCRLFARTHAEFSLEAVKRNILAVLSSFQEALKHPKLCDLRPVLAHVDALSENFFEMESAGAPANYIVRLKTDQSTLRRLVFRVSHIQRIQFVPSVHVLVQALVFAIVSLLLFLKTEGSPESALIFGALSFMFIYSLYLVNTLEQPFRKGRQSLDDVSLFLLRECEEKIRSDCAVAAATRRCPATCAPAHTE